MIKPAFFFFLGAFLSSLTSAQFSQQYRDSINRLSYEDHQQMMLQLDISELSQRNVFGWRHGRAGLRIAGEKKHAYHAVPAAGNAG
jgi:hypothetical protein